MTSEELLFVPSSNKVFVLILQSKYKEASGREPYVFRFYATISHCYVLVE